MPPTAPTPHAFAIAYRDVIRVGLNWDRFFAERWPVEVVTLTTPADLARCFMPWYIGVHGQEVAYDDPDAVPMSLADVPKATTVLNDERKRDLQEYVDKFSREGGVVRFTAPTYALPDDQYFLLDKNHRLAALAVLEVPFEVTLWNVRGPFDADALLDLTYWTSRRKTDPPPSS